MTDDKSPTDLVFALIKVVNGDAPRLAAQDILDPMVQIRMDSARYCGIDVWYKWIHLIRNCGRIADLRMTRCEARHDAHDPSVVCVSARWSGTVRSLGRSALAPSNGEVRYQIENDRITKIWTHKSNYEFIFGRWIKYPIGYGLLLGWSVFYFALLSLRKRDFLHDLN